MRDSHRDNKGGFGGGRSFGGDRGGFGGGHGGRDSGGRGGFGGGRAREDREMHSATCAKCGKSCQVPFRPTGDKPVYCSDCFKNKDGGMSPRRDEGRSFERSERPSFNSRPSFENKGADNREEFRAINDKLEKIMKLLTKDMPAPTPAPKADKPEVKAMKVAAVVEEAIGKKITKKKETVKEVAKPKKTAKKK